MPAIQDLTQAEAKWQHPSYATLEVEDGWPPSGSILWHIAHLIHCIERYVRVLTQWDTPTVNQSATFDSLNLSYLLARLQTAHTALAFCIENAHDDELDTTKSGMTKQEFILMCIRHDSWHAAQIAMARRLYAHSLSAD